MKSTITITGQISGNFTLRNALVGNSTTEEKTMFNGFRLHFDTKKAAINAIREAYNSLCKDEPEMKGRLSGISADKGRTYLRYDASNAKIDD